MRQRPVQKVIAWLRIALAPPLLATLGGCLNGPLIEQQVERGVYVGRMPTHAGDYDELKAKGVKTILSLQAMPWDVWPEKAAARRRGFEFINVPLYAVPWPPPSETKIERVLTTMTDPTRRPIFVHCRMGHDRAAMIADLYRMYYLGWSADRAWAQLTGQGFQVHGLHGYAKYFWSHAETPDWARTADRRRKPQ